MLLQDTHVGVTSRGVLTVFQMWGASSSGRWHVWSQCVLAESVTLSLYSDHLSGRLPS
jgi:hypothetical protein